MSFTWIGCRTGLISSTGKLFYHRYTQCRIICRCDNCNNWKELDKGNWTDTGAQIEAPGNIPELSTATTTTTITTTTIPIGESALACSATLVVVCQHVCLHRWICCDNEFMNHLGFEIIIKARLKAR